MARLIGDVCLDIARFAEEKRHDFLSYILKLAAAEAYQGSAARQKLDWEARPTTSKPNIVGFWDWDITNNRSYLDRGCAEFFGVDPDAAARGKPLDDYLHGIHPDDIKGFSHTIDAATRLGGAFEAEYRLIVNDRIHWVYARGHVTLDRSGRPIRMPGAVIDLTREKTFS